MSARRALLHWIRTWVKITRCLAHLALRAAAFAACKYSALRLAPYGVAGEDPGVQRGQTAALVGRAADLAGASPLARQPHTEYP
jgi:hypothetical protein